MEPNGLYESYKVAENMEYFQWLQRRLQDMQGSAEQRLVAADNWDSARFAQGQIDAFRMALAALVPDEARL